MLLQELTRSEAVAFINVVTEFINVDQNINVEEKEVLEKYLSKFNITKEEVKSIDNEAAIKTLVQSSDRIKNITYFELLGLALIDGEYENSEIDYLENLAVVLNISRVKKIAFANFYFDYDNAKALPEEERKNKIENIIK